MKYIITKEGKSNVLYDVSAYGMMDCFLGSSIWSSIYKARKHWRLKTVSRVQMAVDRFYDDVHTEKLNVIAEYGDDEPHDWVNDENTFKIHPESDPIYTDYTSKINSIDNYKLPDDFELPNDHKIPVPGSIKPVRDGSKCPISQMTPCFGGSDYVDKDGNYTNCILEADLNRCMYTDGALGEKKDD